MSDAAGGRSTSATLDAFVRDNRFTIAVVFPVVGALALVGSAAGVLPGWLAYNPLLILGGTLVMRLPVVAALFPLVDRRALASLAALVAFTYAVEAVGVATGWPYGQFHYLQDVGPMVGGVPVALPLFFVPLAVNAYLLAVLLLGRDRSPLALVPAAVAALLVVDLVLDPAAVAIDFWTYGGGVYYGVPVSNFRGWLFSGTVAVLLVHVAVGGDALAARLRSCEFALDDLVSFTLLWGTINLVYGHVVPVVLAALLIAALARSGRFDLAFRSAPAG